jgi:hypothetical protein
LTAANAPLSQRTAPSKQRTASRAYRHHANDEPYAAPTGRSFDGKGEANDEEQRR